VAVDASIRITRSGWRGVRPPPKTPAGCVRRSTDSSRRARGLRQDHPDRTRPQPGPAHSHPFGVMPTASGA